ncbi:antibiotic biosynthesis monooxygenase [Acidithiobacillus sp. CV18-2]|uniref:Antibiotic biosynthesis monooxygenase n=1 Tax=Igneacidithiobacillus copahuensis TaxID=2724909 RepID=A0AAE2YNL7_9PROT|nr:antibiotic biosynthesis monooxygenase family protein [Igneacidithiobacillus copahuensis]MBU2755825.1 antibiotic biosynthesis monooxygenase [Acidithiobacillus sp. CV18-3]MBU2756260.1 antibiotic biosynthesis monooxygenase [Acidithiobacillus sp. BN09-2]MBU2777767.1 antibiotic biosynthesis monooxygenase [Acidithiobacillus sp. CV18-2]MBU2795951.1 antibiotic biosynthesis monooxygenase [Acidithiobacillus sp. VAN18-2]MBU2800489.1 antibiotic biosynthesis monooxygenase [Acidithiobacillus sp. VAN18-4]
MQYVVANRVPVKPEFHQEFEERFRRRAGEVEKQPGFVRMEILRPVAEDGMYIVLTHWQDKAAFEAWLRSDDFKAAHKNPLPKEAFGEGGGLEQHEVIISAG